MKTTGRRAVARTVLMVALGASMPAVAEAQTVSAADAARRTSLLRAAYGALEASQYATALERVREAEQIGATPGTHFLRARIYTQQAQPAAAYRAAEQCLATATAQDFSPTELRELRRSCGALRDAALRQAVRLTVRVPAGLPAGLEVVLNGEVVPPRLYDAEQVIESGPVVLSTRLHGRSLWEQRLVHTEGAAVSVEVQTAAPEAAAPPVAVTRAASPPVPEAPRAGGAIAPVPPGHGQEVDEPPSSSRGTMRALAFTAGIAGLVGIGVGAVSGVMFRWEEQSYEAAGCAFMQAPSTACVDQHASFGTLNTLQWVGYLGGGALIATSAILFLAAPSRARAPAVSLGVAPGGLQLGYSGRF